MEMTFPEYRELLVHINKEHSPNKAVAEGHRKVVYMEQSTDMRTGLVFFVTMRGFGWKKTITTTDGSTEPLLDRCHQFLDGVGEPDTEEDARAVRAAQRILKMLVGEFGRNIAEYAGEFGAKDLKFTIPADALKEAIQEAESEAGEGSGTSSTHTGAGDKSANSGKPA